MHLPRTAVILSKLENDSRTGTRRLRPRNVTGSFYAGIVHITNMDIGAQRPTGRNPQGCRGQDLDPASQAIHRTMNRMANRMSRPEMCRGMCRLANRVSHPAMNPLMYRVNHPAAHRPKRLAMSQERARAQAPVGEKGQGFRMARPEPEREKDPGCPLGHQGLGRARGRGYPLANQASNRVPEQARGLDCQPARRARGLARGLDYRPENRGLGPAKDRDCPTANRGLDPAKDRGCRTGNRRENQGWDPVRDRGYPPGNRRAYLAPALARVRDCRAASLEMATVRVRRRRQRGRRPAACTDYGNHCFAGQYRRQ